MMIAEPKSASSHSPWGWESIPVRFSEKAIQLAGHDIKLTLSVNHEPPLGNQLGLDLESHDNFKTFELQPDLDFQYC
jgi:hypothetical protein